MDLGQGRELDDVRERALAIGAVRAHVLDVREEFARDFILPALQAGAVYEGRYPLATALGRPLIAKHLVEIAHIEGATADRARRAPDRATTRCASTRRVARARSGRSESSRPRATGDCQRAEKIAYARERGIPVPATIEQPVHAST